VVVQARHKKKPAKKPVKRTGAKAGSDTLWQRHERDIWIVIMVVIGLFALLAEAGALGPVGRQISRALALTFGVGRFVLPVILLGLAVALISGTIEVERARLSWGVSLTTLSVCGLGHLAGGRPSLDAGVKALAHAGGWIGVLIGGGLYRSVSVGGALVILIALLVIALIITTGIGLRALASATGTLLRGVGGRFASWWTSRPRTSEEDGDEEYELDEQEYESEFDAEPFAYEQEEAEEEEDEEDEEDEEPAPARTATAASRKRAAAMAGHWELPPLSLLVRTKDQKQDRNAVVLAGDLLVEALAAHGVETTLVG
jgi:hypothetical protein